MSISAKDLRERFDDLFNARDMVPSTIQDLRMLVGDIVIWIEQQEAKGEKNE